MDYELELEIWSQAHRSMSAHVFGQMVTEAVESYQRMPGHAELERVYVSNVGPAGFEVLVAALEKRGIRRPEDEVFNLGDGRSDNARFRPVALTGGGCKANAKLLFTVVSRS